MKLQVGYLQVPNQSLAGPDVWRSRSASRLDHVSLAAARVVEWVSRNGCDGCHTCL
jgi:hypothetical protein